MCVGGNCKNYSKKSKVAEMPLMMVVPGPIVECVTRVSVCMCWWCWWPVFYWCTLAVMAAIGSLSQLTDERKVKHNNSGA